MSGWKSSCVFHEVNCRLTMYASEESLLYAMEWITAHVKLVVVAGFCGRQAQPTCNGQQQQRALHRADFDMEKSKVHKVLEKAE